VSPVVKGILSAECTVVTLTHNRYIDYAKQIETLCYLVIISVFEAFTLILSQFINIFYCITPPGKKWIDTLFF